MHRPTEIRAKRGTASDPGKQRTGLNACPVVGDGEDDIVSVHIASSTEPQPSLQPQIEAAGRANPATTPVGPAGLAGPAG